jgi:hypothetical protein
VPLIIVTVTATLGISACNSSPNSPSAITLSQATAKAVVKKFLAEANEVRTKADDVVIPQGATGVALAAFDAAYVNNGHSGRDVKGPAFTLDDVSVVLPCASTPTGAFLAFAETNIFNLGSSTSPAAMVFVSQDGGYKLAAFVQ